MTQGLLSGKKGVVLGVANDKSLAWFCAEELVKQGAVVAFNYHGPAQERRLRDLVASLPQKSEVFPCDVAKDEEIKEFFKNVGHIFGQIDFVIHSIAYANKDDLKRPFVETSRNNFTMALDISAYSLIGVVREALPFMKSGSSVISMSYYGAEKVVPNYNVMGVAKAALEASTRYLADDLGPQNIRVNAISAGPIRTLSSSAIGGLRHMLDATEKHAPMRRNITGDDVAKTAVYLLSDLASGVTGEIVHVDCGFHVLGMFRPEGV